MAISQHKQIFYASNYDYFLINQFKMCFGCSKELSDRDSSYERQFF